jgi:hypothetical protein
MLLQAFATFDVYHFDFRRADNEALGGGRGGRLRRDRGGCRHCLGWQLAAASTVLSAAVWVPDSL